MPAANLTLSTVEFGFAILYGTTTLIFEGLQLRKQHQNHELLLASTHSTTVNSDSENAGTSDSQNIVANARQRKRGSWFWHFVAWLGIKGQSTDEGRGDDWEVV